MWQTDGDRILNDLFGEERRRRTTLLIFYTAYIWIKIFEKMIKPLLKP